MRILLSMVESADGKTTHGDDHKIFRWTSKEDQEHWQKLVNEAELIVMGSKTYDSAKKIIKHQEGKLRVIFTRHPEKYAAEAIPGKLEFTSEGPEELVARLEKAGHTRMLLAGGAQVNGMFFQANLVDEVILTIEPKLLGEGNPISRHTNMVHLKLQDVKKLNEQGTVALYYTVEK